MKPANLGCGDVIADGWINIGIEDRGQEYTLDMRNGLPFDNNTVPYAVCHHVVDLFTPAELADFLLECGRVLVPGGVLRISIADMRSAIAAAERGDRAWFAPLDATVPGRLPTMLDKLEYYVTLGGARKTFLTHGLLWRALQDAGFGSGPLRTGGTIYHSAAIRELDSRGGESIVVEGMK